MKELGRALEKERKEAGVRTQELEREKKRAESVEGDLAKLRSEWELLSKSTYPLHIIFFYLI